MVWQQTVIKSDHHVATLSKSDQNVGVILNTGHSGTCPKHPSDVWVSIPFYVNVVTPDKHIADGTVWPCCDDRLKGDETVELPSSNSNVVQWLLAYMHFYSWV